MAGSCGLAAAVMALTQLGHGDDVTVPSLLEAARRAGMTAQGEMFSAADLARLAAGRPLKGTVRRDLAQPAALVRSVLRGDAVLVPYPLWWTLALWSLQRVDLPPVCLYKNGDLLLFIVDVPS